MNLFDKQLTNILVGMTYPSEGENQPLDRFRCFSNLETLTASDVVEWLAEDNDNFLSVDYEEFMSPRLTTGNQIAQYTALYSHMTALNHHIVVICGEVNVRIYVAGLDNNGNIVGWKTTAVQT